MTPLRVPLAVLLVVLGFGAAAPVARAMSEWWTPPNRDCPTFDSEESCESYCRADPDRCGGAVQCSFKTGDKRPQC